MDAELQRIIDRRQDALARVRALIVDKLHVERAPGDIDADTPLFGAGLGLDSIDAVELVVHVERAFGVRLPSEAAGRRALRTVSTLVDHVLGEITPPRMRLRDEVIAPREALDVEAVWALRERVAIGPSDHVARIRVEGDGARGAVDRVVSSDLLLLDTQMKPSLILRGDGSPEADVMVARDDDAYLVFAEGLDAGALRARIREAEPSVTVTDLAETHASIALHGPWAWELVGELFGPELIGMPYLSLAHTGDVTVIRSGKTGEYGYDLLVPAAARGALLDRVERAGAAFGLGRVSLADLDQAALESNFFTIRREGSRELNALDLGLGVLLSYQKEYTGSRAIQSIRARGPSRGLVTALAARPVREGSRVRVCDQSIGAVVSAGYSIVLGAWVVRAAVERAYAHAGVTCYEADEGGAKVALVTASPPLLDNRSLFVNPARHAYAARSEERFPRVAPGGER